VKDTADIEGENDYPYLATEAGKTFLSTVIEEVGTFILQLSEILFLFYKAVPGLNPEDLSILAEDFDKIMVTQVLSEHDGGKIYDVVLVLGRINFEREDKDLRHKSRMLCHCSPQDIGIDEYLLLNDASPLMQIVES